MAQWLDPHVDLLLVGDSLAMVIYAALIGARGLGFDVMLAIGEFNVGAGFEAGMSIVFLAVIADRITQGFAQERGADMTGP